MFFCNKNTFLLKLDLLFSNWDLCIGRKLSPQHAPSVGGGKSLSPFRRYLFSNVYVFIFGCLVERTSLTLGARLAGPT